LDLSFGRICSLAASQTFTIAPICSEIFARCRSFAARSSSARFFLACVSARTSRNLDRNLKKQKKKEKEKKRKHSQKKKINILIMEIIEKTK
jgi:hypothetical protein